MSIQKENAEIIQEIIRSAQKLDVVLRETYKNIDISIRTEKDGSCTLHVSENSIARCRGDGSVTLLNHPDNQPFVGEVPLLQPIDRDSFVIALLYLGDLNVLYSTRKKRFDLLFGKTSEPKKPDGGTPGPSGGLFS